MIVQLDRLWTGPLELAIREGWRSGRVCVARRNAQSAELLPTGSRPLSSGHL
jgi:hypothetical protein